MLTFEPEGHVYKWDDEVVPSVTQVLEPANDYSHIPAIVMEHAKEVGREVHLACEAIDNGQQYSYTTASIGYIKGYEKFLAETKFKPTLIEMPLYHPVYRYAGTLDRVGSFPAGRMSPKGRMAREQMLDIKTTTTLSPAAGLQTAAYEELVKANYGYKFMRRKVLHLKPTGDYALHEYRDPQDFTVFLSLLNFWRWKHERK